MTQPPEPQSPWPARLALAGLLVLVAALHASVLGLPFGNPDDWFHLDVAAGMVAGEGGAFARAWSGFGASDSLRPTPWILWAIDFALFGWDPAPYFATNLLLHLGGVAAVFVLARSLGVGVAGALAAGAVFGLNLASGEATYYLAARDDATACLLAVVLCAAWPRLRLSRRGLGLALVLLLLCLCSKPTAVAVALALPVLDRLQPGEPVRRRFWAVWAAVLVLWGIVLAVVVGPGGLGGPGGGLGGNVLARPLGLLLAPSSTVGMPDLSVRRELLPLLPILIGLPLARSWRAMGAGALWLLLFLPVPTLWLASQSGLDFGGRQMLMPSVGLALLAAAAMPSGGRVKTVIGWALAIVLLAGLGWRHAAASRHFHDRPDPTIERFAKALEARPADRPLLVSLQRGSQGLSSLLTSGALLRMAGLEQPPGVLLQGSEVLLRPKLEPYGYGRLVPAGPLTEEEAAASWVISDRFAGRWPEFGAVSLRPRLRGELAQSWDFAVGPGGWSGWPERAAQASWEPQVGWRVPRRQLLPEGQVARVLATAHKPAVLLSPELAIEPATVCALELELGDLPRPPPSGPVGGRLAKDGRFALLTWSTDAGFTDAWTGSLLVPLGPGVSTVRLDLSPAWLEAGTVRRLALLPVNAPGQPLVRSLKLFWCAD